MPGGRNCVKGKVSVVLGREVEVTGLKAPSGGAAATVTGTLRPPGEAAASPNPRNAAAALLSESSAVPGALVMPAAAVVGTSDTRRDSARSGLAGLAAGAGLLSGVCGGVMSSYCGRGAVLPPAASLPCAGPVSEGSLVGAVAAVRTGVENVCGPKESMRECPAVADRQCWEL